MASNAASDGSNLFRLLLLLRFLPDLQDLLSMHSSVFSPHFPIAYALLNLFIFESPIVNTNPTISEIAIPIM